MREAGVGLWGRSGMEQPSLTTNHPSLRSDPDVKVGWLTGGTHKGPLGIRGGNLVACLPWRAWECGEELKGLEGGSRSSPCVGLGFVPTLWFPWALEPGHSRLHGKTEIIRNGDKLYPALRPADVNLLSLVPALSPPRLLAPSPWPGLPSGP